MSFEHFADAHAALLWGAFLIAFVAGAVVNKTNFCTMGAVSDLVNMGDSGRMRSWLTAIAVAMLGMALLEYSGMVSLATTFPGYRGATLVIGENVLGGLLFGIGMTLASGCGNKTLIRIGGGNLKSVLVFLIIGVIAYFMLNPLPGTDQTLFTLLFYGWLRPVSVDLGASQDLGYLLWSDDPVSGRLLVGLVLSIVVLVFAFKSREFRQHRDNVLGGVVVGLAVLGGWYLSANIAIDADGESLSLGDYYEQWDMLANSDEGRPAAGRPLATQSYTFINPMGQTFGYAMGGAASKLLTFGVVAVAGIVLGSLVWAVISGRFRVEWFRSGSDFVNHVIGAVLMGLGGTLAMGCTIGQAITGVSTLAVGSMLTFGAIFLGSALTMKVQYYKMVYEDEATIVKALVTGLVDLRLLPEKLRQLDAI